MCGVVGIFSSKELNDNAINPMIKSLHHRGPDASNYLYNQSKNVLFGHTRLAIIDLSDAGAQPMRSISQRYVISFNGEIYNFEQLKSSLIKTKSDIRFRGKSDTEVLINYIEVFGVDKTLKDIEGMFAFALWDEKEKTLILARDRAGEKPLYYGYHKGCLYFSSELKAIQSKFDDLEICYDSIRLLLKYNCIPAPKTIYKNFYKVEPASYVKFDKPDDQPMNIRYFEFSKSKNEEDSIFSSDDKAVDRFENLLKKAVKSQMVADVPLGAFLSGGVDSSLIAALMQENSSNPIKTYSIGFNNESYNEAPFSKKISEVIGSDHHELYIDDSEMINLINDLPNIYCEPFSDSSQIPTYFVSKFASESVKVALTGDAGDEMFGGYNRYLFADKYFNNVNSLPRLPRKLVSKAISSIPSNSITSLGTFLYKILNKKAPSDFGGKAHKFSTAMMADDLNQLHDINTTHWNENSKIYNIKDFDMPYLYRNNAGSIANVNGMLRADFYGYLHDDNLCKVDRAAMAVSLETRVPFLDKSIINFAANLPFKFKIRDNETKWILKETLYRRIPKKFFERPKAGFAIPIDEWMRSSLKEMIDHLIYDLILEDSEVINYQEIKKIWKSFLDGDNSYTYHMWDIIMLKAWLERH